MLKKSMELFLEAIHLVLRAHRTFTGADALRVLRVLRGSSRPFLPEQYGACVRGLASWRSPHLRGAVVVDPQDVPAWGLGRQPGAEVLPVPRLAGAPADLRDGGQAGEGHVLCGG